MAGRAGAPVTSRVVVRELNTGAVAFRDMPIVMETVAQAQTVTPNRATRAVSTARHSPEDASTVRRSTGGRVVTDVSCMLCIILEGQRLCR